MNITITVKSGFFGKEWHVTILRAGSWHDARTIALDIVKKYSWFGDDSFANGDVFVW